MLSYLSELCSSLNFTSFLFLIVILICSLYFLLKNYSSEDTSYIGGPGSNSHDEPINPGDQSQSENDNSQISEEEALSEADHFSSVE